MTTAMIGKEWSTSSNETDWATKSNSSTTQNVFINLPLMDFITSVDKPTNEECFQWKLEMNDTLHELETMPEYKLENYKWKRDNKTTEEGKPDYQELGPFEIFDELPPKVQVNILMERRDTRVLEWVREIALKEFPSLWPESNQTPSRIMYPEVGDFYFEQHKVILNKWLDTMEQGWTPGEDEANLQDYVRWVSKLPDADWYMRIDDVRLMEKYLK